MYETCSHLCKELALKSTNLFSEPQYSLFPGVAAQIFYGEQLMVMRVSFTKAAVAQAHAHHNEQLSVVLTGEVEFTLGDEKKVLQAGDALSIPGNVVHSATALVDSELIECFTPLREDFIKKFSL